MNASIYELAALGARYVFAAVMLLIVVRAWRITIVDSRRAASLRRYSPETGVCGEFLVLHGDGRVRDGMRYPVIREGLIGSSRKADVRLRSHSVRRAHAYFELTPKGLHVRTHANSRLYNARGESRSDMYLADGSRITIGKAELMLILTESTGIHAEPEAYIRDDLFDVPAPAPAPASDENRRRAVPWDDDESDTDPLFDIPTGAPPQEPASQPAPGAPEPASEPAPEPSVWKAPAPQPRPDVPLWDDGMDETPRRVAKPQNRHADDPFDI